MEEANVELMDFILLASHCPLAVFTHTHTQSRKGYCIKKSKQFDFEGGGENGGSRAFELQKDAWRGKY